MLNENGLASRSHGLRREIIDTQANAIGIPIVYGKATWEAYEQEFKRIIKDLKKLGVEGGVFGDLNLPEHKEWVENVCGEAGLKALEPLWNERYETLLNEFLDNNFEALIVSGEKEEWIGRQFNREFIEQLRDQNIDLCGEKGEYHTLVTGGPLFKQRIKVLKTNKKREDNRSILEIIKFIII